jgi:hypothetical protein
MSDALPALWQDYDIEASILSQTLRETGVASGRLFLCAGCRGQAIICSCCDRGQIFAADVVST